MNEWVTKCRTTTKSFTIKEILSWKTKNYEEVDSRTASIVIEQIFAYHSIACKILAEYTVNGEDDKIIILSHHQLLNYIDQFVNNIFPLSDLVFYPEWNGKYFKDLIPGHQRIFLNRNIDLVILEPMMSEQMKDRYCRVFHLINK